MYILLTKENTVSEIIPDEDPIFPGISVEDRYTPDFVKNLMYVDDETEVAQNWIYEPESETFSEPPHDIDPGPDEPIEPGEPTVTELMNILLGVNPDE